MTFWVLVAVMVAVSCSVKEDRGDCPCYLELDCSELDRAFVDVEGVAERFSFGDLIRAEEYGSLHEYQVPRGELRLIINGIIGKMIVWDSRFLPWEGQQMDSLFARSVLLDTRCDGVREVLRLNKQFATVTLAFAWCSGVMFAGWIRLSWSLIPGLFALRAGRILRGNSVCGCRGSWMIRWWRRCTGMGTMWRLFLWGY